VQGPRRRAISPTAPPPARRGANF